ncbi:Histone demethylase JHDM2-like protein [Abortiporus biennis]
MNGLQDQGHKRTSIEGLLNPVASAPSHLDHRSAYASNQLSNLSSQSSYINPGHQQHVSSQPTYPPPMHTSSSSFSLRAASWDHAAHQDPMVSRRQDVDNSSSCRYGTQPQVVSTHPVYSEQYQRPVRSVDEPSNYGMDVPPWTSSHETQNVSYGQSLVGPIYPDQRADVSSDNIPKNYTGQPSYDRDAISQSYPPSGYYPVIMTNPNSRGGLQAPHPILVQPQHRNQGAPHPAYYHPPVAFAAIPVMAAPPQPQKRALEADDDQSNGKHKKSRTKGKTPADGNAAPSRRGYNAKKRSEAAQIAAQNAMVPMFSYVPVPTDKGKEKAADGNEAPTSRVDGTPQYHPELQFARCMSNRYRSEEFPRCVSCTRRWAGDTCRFQSIRFFLKDDKRNIVGISFVENQKPDGPTMNFPVQWNISLKPTHIRRVKRTVAQALFPILQRELQHLENPEVIRRPRESEVRATCDTCMTSIFSCSWMCRLCGREACAECFEQVKELTVDRVGADEAEIAALQARKERHAHINPFFLSCTRRNEHRARDFSPMSRFSKDELAQAIKDMEAMLAEPDEDALPPESGFLPNTIKQLAEDSPNGLLGFGQLNASINDVDGRPYTNGNPNGFDLPPDPSTFSTSGSTSIPNHVVPPSSTPCHPTRYFTEPELTEDVFRRIWALGDPLVVTGLLHKFRITWTPEYFAKKYGTQSCLILECQTDRNNRVTVGEFFNWFGKYEGRVDCWKLKDWPPSTDFKTAFPELYEDFSQATPIPNYVRRDGVLNIASHFPGNTVAPDLGPKMYNAMASFESQGSKGSTRLHMDMSDAINIMTYAAVTPDGKPGSAAWDLFKAEDSAKLRKFLKKKFKGQYQHDPIHSQQFYLDSHLRQELYEDYGVKSHRIYQKPGDAVFIPAGCAHQVCNLADCIKVACDFVSPENIDRCETLTREFREQNQSMAWKEDVLQLRTMMWFAWLSCCRQEKDMNS